jgi:tryptophanyl-tRNA synthetase
VRKIRGAVTDSGKEVRAAEDKPAITNLLTIFSLVTDRPVADLEREWAGSGYGAFKAALGEAVVDHLAPIRKAFEEAMRDPAEIDRVLASGAERAEAIAAPTVADVRERAGLLRRRQ